MDDDFSFLTGGLGDLNSDGKVDFGELLNEEHDYKNIMKGKASFSKSGSSADKLKRNNSDDAENSKSENNEGVKPGKVITVLVLFVLMWYCFYFEDTFLYNHLKMIIGESLLITISDSITAITAIIILILVYFIFRKEKKSDK